MNFTPSARAPESRADSMTMDTARQSAPSLACGPVVVQAPAIAAAGTRRYATTSLATPAVDRDKTHSRHGVVKPGVDAVQRAARPRPGKAGIVGAVAEPAVGRHEL